jgi:hypothetical protein
VRHVPWHAQKPAAAAPGRPAVVANAVLAPRAPLRVRPARTPGTHGNMTKAENAKPKQADKLKTHGRGAQTRAPAAASAAARHVVKVANKPQRAHSARGAATHKKVKPKAKPAPHQSAAPDRPNPPAGHGKSK